MVKGEVKGGLRGDPPISFFFLQFFFDFCFLWGYTPPGTRHRNMVNVQPVRILLECILVKSCFCFDTFYNNQIRSFNFSLGWETFKSLTVQKHRKGLW